MPVFFLTCIGQRHVRKVFCNLYKRILNFDSKPSFYKNRLDNLKTCQIWAFDGHRQNLLISNVIMCFSKRPIVATPDETYHIHILRRQIFNFLIRFSKLFVSFFNYIDFHHNSKCIGINFILWTKM